MKSSDMVLIENFLTATRDAGYRGLSAAISELLDNSIQAGARRISVTITNPNGIGDRGATISVSDDGVGMSAETLRGCLRFGWSTRFNDRSGPGRFGMGLPNASLSHARRIDVFTRRHRGRVLWTYFDLDRPAPDSEPIPPPVAVVKWPCIHRRSQGTTIVWTKCDRLDSSRLNALIPDLKRELGRLFRFHLWKGVSISVNSEALTGVDPLFLKHEGDAVRGRQYGPPLRFNIASPGGRSGEVIVRFTELPIRKWSRLPNCRKQQLGLLDNGAVSIVRCYREIDRGWYFMGKKRRQNYDNWWRCEVCFDAALDELFGITHTKQGINPTRVLKQMLTPSIEKIARDLSTRARAAFAAQALGRTPATRAIEKKDILLEPPVRIARTASTRGDRMGDRRGRRPLRLRFCVEHPTVEDNQFFNVRSSAGELVVMLNADHAFYERFYSRLNSHSFAATGPVLKHIEVMLLAAARAESLVKGRSERIHLSRFRGLWSQVLSTYLA
jgi:hypothetical protein